ncbi:MULTISPECIES: hypothetical protein [unclassified Bradyrhizobium]|uniref:hypothetical protein n=1 Tax=unclassified Bradyrhizobium TaxID=2631580 RepID=UPI001BA9AEC2|nr:MULTISPECIES: hypothetical protein [unclassified Bradyrhizobium]MBR1208163.1 hypothetical protein [Bradyrhizobium sp. AUGA SZCCT0124]MBR1344677.1 hypothetical protein [Bradyrhizobium sp. AUGA SZCCT0105]MBR1359449.1 hypothetical protein [Bradyrhizobium sp. AUGA SZCCT0045]
MHPNPAHAIGTARRRTSLSRFLLAVLCVVGLCASLLQPVLARVVSKADQTVFVKNHTIKGGKPCQRVVPGAVGTSCSAGAMAALDATSSVFVEPQSSAAGDTPLADMALLVQWLGAPQFRPPRIHA